MAFSERSSDRVFYGWWIVTGSFLTLFISVGVGLYVPPVFLVPLQNYFGWSRAEIAAGSAIAALTSGAVSPLVGVWIDRFGSRAVMTAGGLLMGGAFALLGLISSVWQLYLLNGLAAVGISCVAWIPTQTLIANWFARRRGLAMGIALTGIGFGGLFMAPLAALLIGRFGWRWAFTTLGSLIFVVVVAVVLALVRSHPADVGLLPDGDLPEPESASTTSGGPQRRHAVFGLDLSQAVRTRTFWVLSAANLLGIFASLSVVAHLVAFLRDAGYTPPEAAASLGLTVGASVAGRVAFGYLADRWSKQGIMAVGFVLFTAAMLMLFRIRSAGALPSFIMLFGFALGGTAVLMPLLVGECFGLLAFGKILGLVMVSSTLGAAAGPVLTGRIYDVTGSYHMAFVIHTAAFIAAGVIFYFLPRSPLAAANDG